MGTKLEQLEMFSSSIGRHWSKILRVEGNLHQIEEKMETNYNNIIVKGSIFVKSKVDKLRFLFLDIVKLLKANQPFVINVKGGEEEVGWFPSMTKGEIDEYNCH